LFEHCCEQVFWLNLLIVLALGELNCRLYCFLSPESKFV
jgi:hypothetical protein